MGTSGFRTPEKPWECYHLPTFHRPSRKRGAHPGDRQLAQSEKLVAEKGHLRQAMARRALPFGQRTANRRGREEVNPDSF